jgi:chemosensory pili system protein ChpC
MNSENNLNGAYIEPSDDTEGAVERPDAMYAVLVAVTGDTLLVPNIAVAEAISRDNLQIVEGPPWLLGIVNWSSRRVPIIRFETLNSGGEKLMPGTRDRLLILQAVSSQIGSGLFGIVAEGYPHLLSLNRDAVISAPLRANDRPDMVMARARIANQEVAIPNFDSIELELAQVVEVMEVGAA